jgi:RNA recognition motif-containing protein
LNAQYNNETNLFTKNLKKDVTAETLQKAFEQFGTITSCSVKAPPANKKAELQKEVTVETLQGFINFKEKEDAR